MPLVYDNTRSAKDGGGYIERSDLPDWITRELPQLRQQAQQRYDASKRRWGVADKVATAAAMVPFAAAAAPALTSLGSIGGGGTAAGAGSVNGLAITPYAGTAAMHAPGVASSLSSAIPWLRLSEIGVNSGMNLWGQHTANKASERAMAMDMAAQAQYRKQVEQQLALDREKFDADQEQNRLDRLASDDDRAYTRKLSEDREGRRAPFRTVGRNALFSLADIAKVRY